jgi:antitoxin ParD1/3/4
VQVGLDELERGEGIDGEIVMERLREKLRNARESAS